MRIKCVLSDLKKIAANLDMYRNFFAMLVWHSFGAPSMRAFRMLGLRRPRLCALNDRRKSSTRSPSLRGGPAGAVEDSVREALWHDFAALDSLRCISGKTRTLARVSRTKAREE